MKLLRIIVACPQCGGTGQEWNDKHRRLAGCAMCDKRGWVPLEACLGCGAPAFKFWPPKQEPIITYCGKEECLHKLVTFHLPGIKEAAAYKSNGVVMLPGPVRIEAPHKKDLRDELREMHDRQRALGVDTSGLIGPPLYSRD